MTINDESENSTIKHYDDLGKLVVEQCAMHSYYENGTVSYAKISKGHVVVNGSLEMAYTTSTNSSEVIVEGNVEHAHAISETAANSLNNNTATDSVTWDYDGETGTTHEANTAAGTYDPEVAGEKIVEKNQFTLAGEYTLGDGETLEITNANLHTFTYSSVDDQNVASIENGVLTAKSEGTATITADNGQSCTVTVTRFHDGEGTKAKPYQLVTTHQWNNMYVELNETRENLGTDYSTLYFSLENDLDFTGYRIDPLSDSNWNHIFLEGNDHALLNISDITYTWGDTVALFPALENSTIQDLTINYQYSSDEAWGITTVYMTKGDSYFNDVTTTGYIYGLSKTSWISTFVMYPHTGTTYYKNCSNEADLTGFMGSDCYITPFGSHCGYNQALVSFEKCTNYGTISGGDAAGFVGMGNPDKFIFVGSDAAINYGKINGAKAAGHFQYGSSSDTFTAAGTNPSVTNTVKGDGSSLSKISSFTTTVPTNYGDNFSFEGLDGASSYSVRITISSQRYNYDSGSNKDKWSGGFPITVYSKVVDAESINTIYKKAYVYESDNSKLDYRTNESVSYDGLYAPEGFNLDDATILLEDNGFYLVEYEGKTFYYLNLGKYDGLLTSEMQSDSSKTLSVSFNVVAYNGGGNVIGTSSCNYSFSIADARSYSAD